VGGPRAADQLRGANIAGTSRSAATSPCCRARSSA
jgi:hypothetical protein